MVLIFLIWPALVSDLKCVSFPLPYNSFIKLPKNTSTVCIYSVLCEDTGSTGIYGHILPITASYKTNFQSKKLWLSHLLAVFISILLFVIVKQYTSYLSIFCIQTRIWSCAFLHLREFQMTWNYSQLTIVSSVNTTQVPRPMILGLVLFKFKDTPKHFLPKIGPLGSHRFNIYVDFHPLWLSYRSFVNIFKLGPFLYRL